ncbi:MAG: IS1634 family transposase [Acidimicrobiia bacterium]
MYVERVPNRGSPPAVLLRESYREGGKVKKRTLANLSSWPEEQVEALRAVLRGEPMVPQADAFEVRRSLPHGDAAAVWTMARRLGFPALLGPPSRERDLAMALLCARVIRPASKLATTRWWGDTTLGWDLGGERADTDAVYAAMDWLGGRQEAIQERLAGRHLEPGGLVLFDVSSSWMEGRTCPLAAFGHPRDGRRGKPQITYGVVTNREGCPVAVEVFAGNTADPRAFTEVVGKVRERFGLWEVVMVGDRGMVTQARIDALRDHEGMGWITALRAPAIKALARESGPLQLSLFDEGNLAEITHPDYPGERLVACRNPLLAEDRARTRAELLWATEAELDKIRATVEAGRLRDPAKIGVRVGKKVNRYKVAKHFDWEIGEGHFSYRRQEEAIATEAALDGVYLIRTSVGAGDLSAQEVVEAYKSLSWVEQLFRSLKTVDLDIRPIHHRLAQRVRAHVFLCLLAAYLVWHLRRAWAPLTFADEEPPPRTDPVARAERSAGARTKASRQKTPDGRPVHSFRSLLDHLATLTRNEVSIPAHPHIPPFKQLARPTEVQRRAFELLEAPIPLRLSYP